MASNYGRAPAVLYESAQGPYWTNQTYVGTPTMIPASGADLAGSIVTCTFSRTEAVGIREDVAGFSLAMFVDGGVATPTIPLNAAQAATVEGFIDTWYTAMRSYFTPHWTQSGYVWRDFNLSGPISTKTGNVMPSAAWRTTTRSVAGNGVTNYMPDQVAASATLKTSSRKHWGRVYVPTPVGSQISQYGRLTSTYVDGTAAAFDTLFNSMGTNATKFIPVVLSLKYRGMLTLVSLKVDDVPDIIRSRRSKIKTYEKKYDNTA